MDASQIETAEIPDFSEDDIKNTAKKYGVSTKEVRNHIAEAKKKGIIK